MKLRDESCSFFYRFTVLSEIAMTDYLEKHLAEYGSEPVITVGVPGVSRFLGPFADYSRGCSLCAADSRILEFCLSLRSDSQIKVYNSLINDRKHFSVSSLKFRREDRWANYIKGVLSQLSSEGYKIPGMNITLCGDVLSGNNDIVCSAIIVATCLSMEKLFDISLEDSVLSRMIVKACLSFSGENCSSSVVRTMLCAKRGKFVFFNSNNGEYRLLDNPYKNSNYVLLYIQSGVPINVMRDEIGRRYSEIKELCDRSYPSLSIPIMSNLPDSEVRERISSLTEDEKRMVLYLVEEYKSANISSFSDLNVAKAIGRTGKAMRNILEFSFPELEWIIKRASENSGCIGNTIVATGGNGIVGVVINRNSVDSFLSKLEDYEHIFGFKIKVSEFEPLGGAGVIGKDDENSSDK